VARTRSPSSPARRSCCDKRLVARLEQESITRSVSEGRDRRPTSGVVVPRRYALLALTLERLPLARTWLEAHRWRRRASMDLVTGSPSRRSGGSRVRRCRGTTR
jgi:hypothetical protein